MALRSTTYGCVSPSRVSVRGPRGPETTSASTCPARMASSVASASCRRARMDFPPPRFRAPRLPRAVTATRRSRPQGALRAQVQSDERALGIGQVPHQLADRFGQPAHQCWKRKDLIALRQLRVLEEIDHLDAVSSLEVLLADRLEVRERHERSRGLPGDVEPELVKVRTTLA